ncbi:MAG: hypothetical protein HQL48_00570 [Gammaproteobacteria bacterium]|nr:hypothetical protein [Gammaproteobacteria bacterium]
MLKALFKLILFLLLWSLIGVVIIAVTLFAGYTIELGVQIFIVTFSAWFLCCVVIRKLYRRYQAKKRVEKLIHVEESTERDESASFLGGLFGFVNHSRLQQRLLKLHKFLAKSRLKEQGDPLYALPWFLLLGGEDQRRKAFYSQADLTETAVDVKGISSHGHSFEWFLTNKMVMVDTPKQIFGLEGKGASSEWVEFAKLLRKYRSKECLNGVVITLDATLLGERSRTEMRELGREWRRKIDQLMKVTTMRLPLYLVVTGVEQLDGSSSWWREMSEEQREEPFGALIVDSTPGSKPVIAALQQIIAQMKEHQLKTLYSGKCDSELLLFPEGIAALGDALEAFSETFYEYNAYHSGPINRGLYFSGSSSDFDKGKTLHAKQFLEQVLPSQRGVIEPLESAMLLEARMRLFWRAAWLTILIVVGGGLYHLYQNHSGYLVEEREAYAGKLVSSTSGHAGSITTLSSMRTLIMELEETISGWWLPWYTPTEKDQLFSKLKKIYVDRFYSNLGEPANRALLASIQQEMGRKRRDHVTVGNLVMVLSRRIALLEEYIGGGDADDLGFLAEPYDSGEWLLDGTLDSQQVTAYNQLYIQYLLWSHDLERAQEELILLKREIDSLVLASGEQLQWVIEWANLQLRGNETLLKQFWQGSGRFDNTIRVEPAFTLEGKALIESLLAEVTHQAPIAQEVPQRIARFRDYYQGLYLDSWEAFLKGFSSGSSALRGRREWLEGVESLARGGNPFFSVLEVSYAQLEPWLEEGVESEWLTLLDYYQTMKMFSPNAPKDNSKQNKTLAKMGLGLLAKAGPVGKALAKAGKSGMKSKKKLDKASGGKPEEEDERDLVLEESGKLLGDYITALGDVAMNSEIRSVSHMGMVNLFTNPDNPGIGSGPEARAYESIRQLQILLGKRDRQNAAFWDIYGGSVDLALEFMLEETSCYLQENWMDNVLASLQGVPKYKEAEAMVGEGGKLWSFIGEGDAAPFIALKYGAGYVPQRVNRFAIPFNREFLEYTNRGGDALESSNAKIPVAVAAKPTGTSKDALFLPSKTVLTMECGDEKTTLVNLNFPASKPFLWDQSCTRAKLEIDVGRFHLVKEYAGSHPFVEFLQQFSDGTERVYPAEFPLYEAKLIDSKIEYFDLHYTISGQEKVFASLQEAPSSTPMKIAACWPARV